MRIYFDSSTFDKISKVRGHRGLASDFLCDIFLQDRKAKFVDQLSAIGGTMGLLTGFSIISGVEILYFTAKIIVNIWKHI